MSWLGAQTLAKGFLSVSVCGTRERTSACAAFKRASSCARASSVDTRMAMASSGSMLGSMPP